INPHAEIVRCPGPLSEKKLLEKIKGVDGVIASHDPFTRKIIENADRLKIIARHGIGFSEIDIDAATERGIFVTYTPVPEEFDSVAEFTVGLILALARKISFADRLMKKGVWKRTLFIGSLLKGKTVGIVGLGNIGKRVARLVADFKATVIAYDPYLPEEIARKYHVKLVDFITLLKNSDIITLHCPLTEETRGLIGWKEVELMKPGVLVVNTARGPIFPKEVLFKALKEGKIAGAAIDVYEKEPPNLEEPLFKLDNVIVTPHIAAYTREGLRKMDITVASDVVKVLKGKIPKYLVNKSVLTTKKGT
ncbi:MAG: phosphoglycerate dehydrogenase, partial [Candidatus Baldrarchaeia archaeon]